MGFPDLLITKRVEIRYIWKYAGGVESKAAYLCDLTCSLTMIDDAPSRIAADWKLHAVRVEGSMKTHAITFPSSTFKTDPLFTASCSTSASWNRVSSEVASNWLVDKMSAPTQDSGCSETLT